MECELIIKCDLIKGNEVIKLRLIVLVILDKKSFEQLIRYKLVVPSATKQIFGAISSLPIFYLRRPLLISLRLLL